MYRACQDSYWGILNHIGSKNSFGLPGYTVVPFVCSLERALKQDVNSNSPLIIKHLKSSDRVQRMKVFFRDSKENSNVAFAVASHYQSLKFFSYKHVLYRFTSFIRSDRRIFRNCFQQRMVFYETPVFHHDLFNFLCRRVVCSNKRQ